MTSPVVPPTLREKSSWTPKHNKPANEKIFRERFELFKKWYSAWREDQRWELVQYILLHLSDDDLHFIHSLLDPLIPRPPPPETREDFIRLFPRHLSLKIFSYLDPRSLCRAAQVSWYWRYLCEQNMLWKPKCLRYGWFLPEPPLLTNPTTVWKRHYVTCVCHMYWKPPQAPSPSSSPPRSPSLISLPPPLSINHNTCVAKHIKRRSRSHTHHGETFVQPPWKHPNRYPKDLKKTTIFESSLSLKPIPHVRSQPHISPSDSQTTLPIVHANNPPHVELIQTNLETSPCIKNKCPSVPLKAMLHPSLIEKLRVGTPTNETISISNINHNEKEDDKQLAVVVQHVQSHAPFPSLPPYYVKAKEKEEILESNSTLEKHTKTIENDTQLTHTQSVLSFKRTDIRRQPDSLQHKFIPRIEKEMDDIIRPWCEEDFLSDTDSESN